METIMSEAKDTGYNGWKNYETWNVKLWIDNDEGTANYWRDAAREAWTDAAPGEYEWQTREQQFTYHFAAQLRDEHQENTPDLEGVYVDLLNAALGEVDWSEIAASYLEDVKAFELENADDNEEL